MAAPVTLAQLRAAQAQPFDNICERLRKRIWFAVLWYRLMKYMFTSTGRVTTQFSYDICTALAGVGCSGATTSTTTSTST